MCVIQHCFICCPPSDFTVSEDAGTEPRTVATLLMPVRRSNHSAKSHPLNMKYRLTRMNGASEGLPSCVLFYNLYRPVLRNMTLYCKKASLQRLCFARKCLNIINHTRPHKRHVKTAQGYNWRGREKLTRASSVKIHRKTNMVFLMSLYVTLKKYCT
jgi:hypothetical protein